MQKFQDFLNVALWKLIIVKFLLETGEEKLHVTLHSLLIVWITSAKSSLYTVLVLFICVHHVQHKLRRTHTRFWNCSTKTKNELIKSFRGILCIKSFMRKSNIYAFNFNKCFFFLFLSVLQFLQHVFVATMGHPDPIWVLLGKVRDMSWPQMLSKWSVYAPCLCKRTFLFGGLD